MAYGSESEFSTDRVVDSNGSKNTTQAIKNNRPPIKPSISPARILEAMKKIAEKTNNTHPHI
jgi:hypothetical protein